MDANSGCFLDQEVGWDSTLEDGDESEGDGIDCIYRCDNPDDSSMPAPDDDPEEEDCQTEFQCDSGQDV